jgi:hypothetical protein
VTRDPLSFCQAQVASALSSTRHRHLTHSRTAPKPNPILAARARAEGCGGATARARGRVAAAERLHKREAGSRRRRDRAADSRLRRRERRARLRGTEAGSQRGASGAQRRAAAGAGSADFRFVLPQFPGVFPFNFLEFFFFSVLASIGSVEPKNRTEQAETELVGF